MQRNIHEKLIQEWAKDTSRVVQVLRKSDQNWTDIEYPSWAQNSEYRLKPYDIAVVQQIVVNRHNNHVSSYPDGQLLAEGVSSARVEFTIDSETRTIKGVKLL